MAARRGQPGPAVASAAPTRISAADDSSPDSGEDAEPSPVVRVRDLAVTYQRHGREVAGLRWASLDVHKGEIVAVVGESGSGKTTFALALTGLLLDEPNPPRVRGAIDVMGVDLLEAGREARRELRRRTVAAVFQDPMTSLNPTMRIGGQLAEISDSEDASVRLLESVGVMGARGRLRSYPHELSGGQRQRVMIAMALARRPALVVADEPTTALDVTIQAQLLDLLVGMRDKTGTAFAFVTHDLGVAAQVADRIAVFYAGRVVEVGPAQAVLERPAHPYTKTLVGSRISMTADRSRPLAAPAGGRNRSPAGPAGCPYAERCDFVQTRCLAAIPPLAAVDGTDTSAACVRAGELLELPAAGRTGAGWPGTVGRNETAVRLEGVGKEFRARGRHESLRALRSIDLEIRAGECLGIVGESGCGKSTLLRVVAGLTEADAGACSVANGGAQMVFQDAAASLTPWLTVGEQIGERLPRGTTRAERRAAVTEALRSVGLSPDVATARSRHLSGGQRQRVALARAIVVPPRVLLCDEPTSAVDVSIAATVLNLIGDLRRRLGMTVVFVTHDLAAARVVADRIAVMYLGRIVETGPADRLASDPGHPYTKALIAAVPDIGKPRPQARGELPDPLSPPGGCPYHPRCAEALPLCAQVDPPLEPFDPEGRRTGACVHLGGTSDGGG